MTHRERMAAYQQRIARQKLIIEISKLRQRKAQRDYKDACNLLLSIQQARLERNERLLKPVAVEEG